jgi:hypothetical protein
MIALVTCMYHQLAFLGHVQPADGSVSKHLDSIIQTGIKTDHTTHNQGVRL